MSQRAVLFVNLHKEKSKDTASVICDEVKKAGMETVYFAFDGKPENPPLEKFDIAFSLGGDGTVLYTSRCLAPFDVPILPVNLGSLGFISGYEEEDNWLLVFHKWKKGEITPSRRCMLEVSVERAGKILMQNICLNDIVISASGIAKLIKLDVSLNPENEIILGSYRCDGLIIATPTGSTAYSLAAGGPILDPEMEAVILNPICPFALSSRPFVLPSRHTITVSLAEEQRSGVLLTIDGQDTFSLESADKIYIKQASKPVNLIFSGRHSYYSALKNKLFWSGGR